MSGSEAGSHDSAESFGSVGAGAEPSAEGAADVPWWKAVCDDIAAGRPVEAVRASLAAQQQAQEFAREERLAAERAAQSRADVEAQNSHEALRAALESRDQRIADLEESLLQGIKDLADSALNKDDVSAIVDDMLADLKSSGAKRGETDRGFRGLT